jgi:hypothetical protein
MTACTYIFGDLLTGQIIGEIPLYGVSMSKGMATGDLRGSFQLDQTGQSNSTLLSATIPGRCYVVCERAGVPVWGGIRARQRFISFTVEALKRIPTSASSQKTF